MINNRIISLLSGLGCGLCFAPIFFLPAIFLTSILLGQIKLSRSRSEAVKIGYCFGFGFYLTTLYWISFGVSVYIDQFWWAIPFALLGLPAFLAIFTAIISSLAWQFSKYNLFHFCFCCLWVFIEWVMSWIFTGLPWGVIGYSLSNWLVMIQVADIFSIFGLSFFVIYIGSAFYNRKDKIELYSRLITSLILLLAIISYGFIKINNNPTDYSKISARIVQPSIPQTQKWDPNDFWQNLKLQIDLSKQKNKEGMIPDIIIWSEAALTVPYYFPQILEAILSVLTNNDQILITGGVGDNGKVENELEIYSSMVGLQRNEEKIFEYYKSHLVPFGEYMPLRNILPLKKITHGFLDYSQGNRTNVIIDKYNLKIWPLICYESIFPEEVRVTNKNLDIIINITNDAWYGNSSGPYQHFEISRLRAVENGLPMIRAANNGISAFIDPVGRVLSKTRLNDIAVLDSFVPVKLAYETIFSRFGLKIILVEIVLVLILQLVTEKLAYRLYGKLK